MVVMECFNDISIMSWNIRGTVGRCTWRHIRDLVKSHHPSIFLIYETHAPISRVDKQWLSLG